MVQIKINRKVEQEEWLEIGNLVDHQQTNDKYTSTRMTIKGDYANIEVFIDNLGDIELL